MVSLEGTVKLIDFRSAVCVNRNQMIVPVFKPTYRLDGLVNKLRYVAPEVLNGQPYNEKADIYSMGILFWQLLTGKTPFSKLTSAESFFTDVASGGLRPKIDGRTDPIVAKLIQSCWRADHTLRPSAGEALQMMETLVPEDSI